MKKTHLAIFFFISAFCLPAMAYDSCLNDFATSGERANHCIIKVGHQIDLNGGEVKGKSNLLKPKAEAFLPKFDFPITAGGREGDNAIVIASSTEKCSEPNSWINQVTNTFNENDFQIQGKDAKVKILCVASGTMHEFLKVGKTNGVSGYTPSADVWAPMVNSGVTKLTIVNSNLVTNIPGLVLDAEIIKKLPKGKYFLKGLIDSGIDFKIVGGDPFESTTNLTLLSWLHLNYAGGVTSDLNSQEVNSKVAGFLNKHIGDIESTSVALNAMMEGDKNSRFHDYHGAPMEWQTFVNSAYYKSKKQYGFLPYPYVHANPLYQVGSDKWKGLVLKKFSEFSKGQEWQVLAKEQGFNTNKFKEDTLYKPTASQLFAIQDNWKSGKPSVVNNKETDDQKVFITFIADNSGSMGGGFFDKGLIDSLKESLSLIFSSDFIKPEQYIGLVTFNYDSNIRYVVRNRMFGEKETKQRLIYGVEQMEAGGGTATYSALVKTAQVMLEENPSGKNYILLLTDGQQGDGINLSNELGSILARSSIKVVPIQFGNANSELPSLAKMLETKVFQVEGDNLTSFAKTAFRRIK